MKNHHKDSPLGIDPLPTGIVGEFSVAGQVYWVVRIPAEPGGSDECTSSETCLCSDEICHFESGGQNFAIVRSLPEVSGHEALAELLTARELQIATLVALGYPNKLVAHRLHISEWTVASYLRRIFAKLGVETRAAMAYRCAPLIERQGSEFLSELARPH